MGVNRKVYGGPQERGLLCFLVEGDWSGSKKVKGVKSNMNFREYQEFAAFGGEQVVGFSRKKEQRTNKRLIVHYILAFQCLYSQYIYLIQFDNYVRFEHIAIEHKGKSHP